MSQPDYPLVHLDIFLLQSDYSTTVCGQNVRIIGNIHIKPQITLESKLNFPVIA